MKKLLATVVAVAPVLALLPAAPASADSVCAPITIDGQPLFCTDLAPVDGLVAQIQDLLSQVAGEAATEIASIEATATGLTSATLVATTECPRVVPHPGGVTLYVAIGGDESLGNLNCSGYRISITATTTGTPAHVPQICLTTTGTCVGPIDETVPGPTATPLELCIDGVFYSEPIGSGDWTDRESGGLGSIGCRDI